MLLMIVPHIHTSPSSHIIKLNRNDNSQTQLCISTYVAAARQMWNTQMLDRSLVDPARLNSIKSTPLPLRKLIGAEQIALSYNKSGALLIKWYLREGAMIKQSYNETNRWFKDQSPLRLIRWRRKKWPRPIAISVSLSKSPSMVARFCCRQNRSATQNASLHMIVNVIPSTCLELSRISIFSWWATATQCLIFQFCWFHDWNAFVIVINTLSKWEVSLCYRMYHWNTVVSDVI